MSVHKEISFEDEICGISRAWLAVRSAMLDAYDRARAIFPPDLLAWVEETPARSLGGVGCARTW